MFDGFHFLHFGELKNCFLLIVIFHYRKQKNFECLVLVFVFQSETYIKPPFSLDDRYKHADWEQLPSYLNVFNFFVYSDVLFSNNYC